MEETRARSLPLGSTPVLIVVPGARTTSETVARWDLRVCRGDPNDRAKRPDRLRPVRLCAVTVRPESDDAFHGLLPGFSGNIRFLPRANANLVVLRLRQIQTAADTRADAAICGE